MEASYEIVIKRAKLLLCTPCNVSFFRIDLSRLSVQIIAR